MNIDVGDLIRNTSTNWLHRGYYGIVTHVSRTKNQQTYLVELLDHDIYNLGNWGHVELVHKAP